MNKNALKLVRTKPVILPSIDSSIWSNLAPRLESSIMLSLRLNLVSNLESSIMSSLEEKMRKQ
jgi:hypothetical protein